MRCKRGAVAERLAHGPKVGRRGGRRKAEAPGVALEASPKDIVRLRPGLYFNVSKAR
jgi:hypothetical protein